MLQSIRDKSTGPIAWAIILLISIPFAFWGIESYMRTSGNPVVAEVGDVEITDAELRRSYDRYYQQLQSLLGDKFDPSLINASQRRREVLENMVQEALLTQHTRDAGYSASDLAVMQALQQNPNFQIDGQFSPERYRSLLAQNGYNPAAYEANLRQAIRDEQLRGGIMNSAFVTQRELQVAWKRRNQQRQASYFEIDAERLAAQIEIDEATIEEYYEVNKQRFMTPERVKLDYVLLNREALESPAEPETEFLRAIYDTEKQSRFSKPERRRPRHILIRVDEQRDDAKARQHIEDLAAQLEAGADFAELAEEHSEDPGSKEKGGLLDWTQRGVMVAEFEESLFDLEQGEVSEPVRTDFGWHLIKLEDVQPAQVKPFDAPEVQAELLDIYGQREREERFRQYAEQLDTQTLEHTDSLQPAAEALDVEVKQSDWLTREGGEELWSDPAVLEAAFSPAVLEDEQNSPPIKLDNDRMLVLRLADREPARQQELAEVRDQIVGELRREQAAEQARSQADEAVAALREGRGLSAVAAQYGGQVKRTGKLKRGQQDSPGPLLAAVFRMPRPEQGESSYDRVDLGDGRFAVIELDQVIEGSAPDKPEEGEALRRSLQGLVAGNEFNAYTEGLRQEYQVSINEDRL